MPKTPKEIAISRLNNTVEKICNLIDKKLEETTSFPLEFTFLNNTSEEVKKTIFHIYVENGWRVARDFDKEESKDLLYLEPQTAVHLDKINNYANHPNKGLQAAKNSVFFASSSSEDGRNVIAGSLEEPINTALSFQSLPRKIFSTDTIDNIKNHIDTAPNHLYYSGGDVKPYQDDCADDITSLMISSGVRVNASNSRQILYHIDKASVFLKDSIAKQESVIMMQLFQSSATHKQTIYTYDETIHRAFFDSISEIESNELVAGSIVVHPSIYRWLTCLSPCAKDFKEASTKQTLTEGCYGSLYGAKVYLSASTDKNEIFVLPIPDSLGLWAFDEVTVSQVYDPQSDTMKFTVQSDCVPIITPENVRKIVVRF